MSQRAQKYMDVIKQKIIVVTPGFCCQHNPGVTASDVKRRRGKRQSAQALQNNVRKNAYAKDETVSIGKVLEKLSELENIITSQNQELRQLKENERNLLQRIQNLEHKHALKERDLENQSLSVTVQKRAPSEPVAFYAYMSSGEQNPGQHQTMAFDHVVTNIASAYNKYTGIFTVPVTGLYVLTITLSGSPSSQIPLQFTRNNEILGAIDLFAASGSVDTNPTVSSTIVVSLSKGDSCFIRTSASYTTAGTIYSTDLSRSSFAGWLVSAS